MLAGVEPTTLAPAGGDPRLAIIIFRFFKPLFEDIMSETHHEEDHSGPIKTPKQVLIVSILAFVIPVFVIIALAHYAAG